MFREEEPTIEECDFASHANHLESHNEVEYSQEDFDYEAASDHVIPAKIVDPAVLANDNKPVNVVVPSDVSDSLSKQETVDSSIDAATVPENEKQPVNSSTKETTYSPPQNQKQKFERDL